MSKKQALLISLHPSYGLRGELEEVMITYTEEGGQEVMVGHIVIGPFATNAEVANAITRMITREGIGV